MSFCFPVLEQEQGAWQKIFGDYNLSSFYSEDMEREVEPGEIMTAYGYIAEGYEYPLLNFVVISETDIFGKNKRKKKTPYHL